MESISLTSLALIKLRRDDKEGDAYSVFEPLVIDLLSKARPPEITDDNVARQFLSYYGLHIPVQSMQHILRRLAKQGYLAREHGMYRVTEKAMPVALLDQDRKEAEENTALIVSEFISFCQKEFDRKISEETAVKAILAFLDKFSVDCLRAYVFHSSLPKPRDQGIKHEYAVGRFIFSAQEGKSDLFKRIIFLVQCQMCANAVLCPDLQSLDRKFGRVSFYLDAPLLLNLIGLHGRPAQQSTEQLLELVRNLEGRLFIFEHSIMEAQTIISNTKPRLHDYSVSNRVLRACRDDQFQLTDIELAEESIDRRLQELSVEIARTPEYVKEHQVSEVDLEAFIRERVTHATDRATIIDINSIRSIFVLRAGIVPLRLEDAGHVFVTDNSALARAAWEYSKEHNSFREVSPVIADYSLANIAWLKAPMKAPDLPTIETLALCYAAVSPQANFAAKLLGTIDQLRSKGHIDAAAHAAIRSSKAYEKELMRLTMGDEEALRPSTAMAALEKLKEQLTLDHVTEITTLEAEKQEVSDKLADANHALGNRERDMRRVSSGMAAGISLIVYLVFAWVLWSATKLEAVEVLKAGIPTAVVWAVNIVLNLAAIYGIILKLRRRLSFYFASKLFGLPPDAVAEAQT